MDIKILLIKANADAFSLNSGVKVQFYFPNYIKNTYTSKCLISMLLIKAIPL